MHYILRQKAQLHAFNYRKGRKAYADGFNITRTTYPIDEGMLTAPNSYTQIATNNGNMWIRWGYGPI